MLARERRVLRATLESGVRSVLLTRGAKRRGAAQKTREFAAFVSFLRPRDLRVVVEIGTLRGGTLWAWCQLAHPQALLVSIDLPGGAFGGGYDDDDAVELRGHARADQRVVLIRDTSHAPRTLEALREVLAGRRVDLLFIDGDHTLEGVTSDFEMYGPLVAEDGVTAFHDILPHPGYPDCHVDLLWKTLETTRDTRVFIDESDRKSRGQWGGIGVVLGTAP